MIELKKITNDLKLNSIKYKFALNFQTLFQKKKPIVTVFLYRMILIKKSIN